MRTALICTTAPEAFVERADVKKQLKIADTDASKDDLLDMYISACCDFLDGADGALKRAVAAQTWTLVLPSFFPEGRCAPYRIELPLPPIRSVTSVKYFDASGNQQTLAADAWRLVNRGTERSRIVPTSAWPSVPCREDAVSIEFIAGYSSEANDGFVPRPKKVDQAVILMVKQLYDLGQRNVFLASDEVQGVGTKSYFAEGGLAIVQGVVDSLLANIRLPG